MRLLYALRILVRSVTTEHDVAGYGKHILEQWRGSLRPRWVGSSAQNAPPSCPFLAATPA